MSPQARDETARRSLTRWAARAEARTSSADVPTQPSSGRHRRPESLADQTEVRSVAPAPGPHRRSVEERFELGDFEDGFIERGFPDPDRKAPRRARTSRAAQSPSTQSPSTQSPSTQSPSLAPHIPQQRAAEAWDSQQRAAEAWDSQQRAAEAWDSQQRAAEAWDSEQGTTERRTTESLYAVQPADAGWTAGTDGGEPRWSRRTQERQGAQERPAEGDLARQHDVEAELPDGLSPRLPGSRGRGKHAAPPEQVVTARALPAVRDAVVEGLPVAKRAADAVREWTLYSGDKPPATGVHRAPGTLPIESWLLLGRGRQQALLATLVAAGLALVMIPIQRYESVNPVSEANRSTPSASTGQKARTKPPAGKAGTQDANQTPGNRATAGSVADSNSAQSGPAGSAVSSPGTEPFIAVPPGTGPGQSLKVTGSQTVALTFDDGPDPVQTPKILAMLDKYQVKATFCLVGRQVELHPAIVGQIVAAGHTLCNHTWNHNLTIGKDTTTQIRADLDRTNAAIRAAVPDAQIPFFRAPGGNFSARLVQAAYGEQMTSLYWQVDPRDWDHSTDTDDATHTERVIAAVRKGVEPGSIILSHDFNQPDTIAAYETLLPWLTEKFAIGLPVAPPVRDSVPPSEPPPSDPPPAELPSPDPPPADPPPADPPPAVPPSP